MILRRLFLAANIAALSLSSFAQEPSPKPVHPVAAVQDTETPAQRDARMYWWRQARFGMFIHWGLYAVPGGVWRGASLNGEALFSRGAGEWIMHDEKIPVADYQPLVHQFNPTEFNAHDWVALAKASGMKYIVITSKHHDGFAMFDSQFGYPPHPFNITQATPFHRDPLAELKAEADKQGIKLGFYYSQDQDWTAPGGAAFGGHWDKAQDGSFADYLHTKAIPQIKELLTRYHPAVIWFDTPTADMTPQLASEIVALLNQYPQLIWNNRLGGGYPGDTETPEQQIPPQGFPGKDWETCMTMNDTWGYKSTDTNFKSNETLLHNLIDIASKGGNYLLNVGPDAHGIIPQPEADRLLAMGKWLSVNGESIYGTGPTLFGPEDGAYDPAQKDRNGKPKWVPAWDWRSTTARDKVYIHLFKWPDGKFHLDQMPRRVTRAYLLADPQHKALPFMQKGTVLDVTLPAATLDPIATVLVLQTR